MNIGHDIDIPADAIAAFCRRHAIVRLWVYGSVLREDFGPDSDLDVLVEFAPNAGPSLLDFGGMQQELCELAERQVDLKTVEFLSPRIRERVLREARQRYAA
jgi:hypothetical protein